MLGEVEIFFNVENHSKQGSNHDIGDVMSHSLKTGIEICFVDKSIHSLVFFNFIFNFSIFADARIMTGSEFSCDW